MTDHGRQHEQDERRFIRGHWPKPVGNDTVDLAEAIDAQNIADRREQGACPFCAIIAGEAPAVMVGTWPGVIAIIPLNPVTQGHVLVLPTQHVEDFADDPDITAEVMRRAAQFATPPANLITSAGPEATQTIRHLHVHVVPRWADDGLALPWTGQNGATR